MEGEHRAVARDGDRQRVARQHVGDVRAELLAARGVRLGGVGGVELAEHDAAGRHRGDVVVERAARAGSRRAGCVSNWSSSSALPPKAPNEKPPPMYLPYVRRSGLAPSSAARPERPWREVITSSAMQTAPAARAAAKTPREERRVGRDAAAGAEHRLDEHRGEVVSVLLDQRRRAGEVVVRRDDEGEGRVPRRPAGREEEDAAVVAAVEDEHLRPPGVHPRGRDRQQVRLGARVREPDAVEPEPRAHQLARAAARTDGSRPRSRARASRPWTASSTRRLAVPEEPGGVVAEQVDVLVSVRVGQDGPLAADERERERLVVEDRARVPARQALAGPRRAAARSPGYGRRTRAASRRRARRGMRPLAPHRVRDSLCTARTDRCRHRSPGGSRSVSARRLAPRMTRLGRPRGPVARRHTRPGGHARLDPALRPRSRTRRDRLRRRPRRCGTRSSSRSTPSASATGATGSRSTTTCPGSRARRRPS